MKNRPPVPQLPQRHLAWQALSDLYLDSELGDEDFRRLAVVLMASGFTWPEILEINYDEVGPALSANLFNYVGQWGAWPEPALSELLIARYTGRQARLLWSRRLWHKFIDYFTAAWLAEIEKYFYSS